MAREYIRATRVIGNIKNFGGILLFDDASNGMTWEVGGNAMNPRCVVRDYGALDGGAMLRMFNDYETIVDDKFVSIQKYFPTCNSNIYTCKLVFKTEGGDHTKCIQFTLTPDNGVSAYDVSIKLDLEHGKLQCLNSDEDWVDLVAVGFQLWPYSWNYLQFGFNMATGKYSKLILNDTEYDISEVYAFPEEDSGVSIGWFRILNYQLGTGASAEIWLDSILITGD